MSKKKSVLNTSSQVALSILHVGFEDLGIMQASMKLAKEQVVALSSAEMVQNYLVAQKSRIADSVKQSLAVAEIFKLENLEVGVAGLECNSFSSLSASS